MKVGYTALPRSGSFSPSDLHLEGTVEDLKSVFKLKTHAPRRYHRDRVKADLAVLGRGQAFRHQPAAVLSGGNPNCCLGASFTATAASAPAG